MSPEIKACIALFVIFVVLAFSTAMTSKFMAWIDAHITTPEDQALMAEVNELGLWMKANQSNQWYKIPDERQDLDRYFKQSLVKFEAEKDRGGAFTYLFHVAAHIFALWEECELNDEATAAAFERINVRFNEEMEKTT